MATTYGDHAAVASWFLGPHAENFEVLEKIFQGVLYEQAKAREAYFPNDDDFITPSMKASKLFQKNISKLKYVINQLAPRLAAHSVPFWNPRYNAHMNMDTTMPGIAGYLMAMMYNPNNVATEASPLTTVLEIDVGKQLCKMIGYNIDITKSPVGWGHITCGGSVANLESMWAARNLKYYPLSVRLAMKEGRPLEFIAPIFRLSNGDGKLFKDLKLWELLNIRPSVVLNIPDRLRQLYGITSQFLQAVLEKYLVQSVGKDSDIFKEFENGSETKLNKMVYFISAAKHYSWPKAAAVTGIGSDNVIDVNVDDDARIDIGELKTKLTACLNSKIAVYAVVAIIGSTEHGACDQLDEIISLRDAPELKDLGFVLHADAAWGAYFCSTLREEGISTPQEFVPAIALKPTTIKALESLKDCDSVTLDPHKSGYIQYPAGGLIYRDQRMRYLITWTSPIVYRDELESIGIYGIEGSKPGAAPVAVWVSHEVIGLHKKGYGALLGEAVFSCVKMYAHLATMSTNTTDFIVTPMNKLPTIPGQDDLKTFIREKILDVDNDVLINDNAAMKVVIQMGSDLAINAFAVNFRFRDNNKRLVTNQDVVEANNLGKRIFERLSISKVTDNVLDKPLVLTSTQLKQSKYGQCLTNFKERLGLSGPQDLYVLVNVVMSPFPTQSNFTRQIADSLQKVIQEEVLTSRYRNQVTRDFHGFVMQGTQKVFLVHLAMFNMANHRHQLIITGDLPADVMVKYNKARLDFPNNYFTLANESKETLKVLLKNKKFKAVIDKGMPPPDGTHLIKDFELTNIKVVVNAPLDSKHLASSYPPVGIPFYLYGSSKDKEYHIDHTLVAAPNIQLSGGEVSIAVSSGTLPTFTDASPYVKIIATDFQERAMQPFPPNKDIDKHRFFFSPGKVLAFKIDSTAIKGTLTLAKNSFVDTDMLNEDPVPDTHVVPVPVSVHDHAISRGRGWQGMINFPRPYNEQDTSPTSTTTAELQEQVEVNDGLHNDLDAKSTSTDDEDDSLKEVHPTHLSRSVSVSSEKDIISSSDEEEPDPCHQGGSVPLYPRIITNPEFQIPKPIGGKDQTWVEEVSELFAPI